MALGGPRQLLILPRNYVQMIEKRALAKLRRDPRIRRLAREAFGVLLDD